ncbi:hypothetical protein PC128_g8749 [Phytophthora cactorum]|nr:hypothetical protein PC128_g8749 [Phytophthora cactorum]
METTHPPKKRKTQVRFDDDHDEALLHEILAVNPFQFQTKMTKSAAASGIEEEHTQRDDVLTNVLELAEEAETARDEKTQEKEAKQRDDERADAMRDEAMTGMRGRNNNTIRSSS